MSAAIRLVDVRAAYSPEQPVLRGLTLEVAAGEIVALLGRNGSGKTTTFRLLAGLLRPDSGTIEIAGTSVLADSKESRRLVGYVPDESLLYPTLSALENLNMFGLLWNVRRERIRERARELLTAVGLWSVRDQWVRSYSLGMRQKVAFCAALLPEPRVLLMDEPFTGLDLDAALWAREHLQQFAKREGTILFTSHTPELVEAFAHSVAILHEGRIVYHENQKQVAADGGLIKVWRRVVNEPRSEVSA